MLKYLFLVCTLIVMLSCNGDNGDYINYPYTSITGYTDGDYFELLNSDNGEIVYNSICNLYESAKSSKDIYHDESADKTSDEYILAKNIYEKIKLIVVESKHKNSIAAGITYLNNFIYYKDHPEMKELVKQIKKDSFMIDYELLKLYIKIYNSSDVVDVRVIKRFTAHKSWIIRSHSMYLVNDLRNEEMRSLLIDKFQESRDEKEKLIILNAFNDDYSYAMFESVFSKEIFNENEKIKNQILENISQCKDEIKITEWIVENYDKLSNDDLKSIENGLLSSFDILEINIMRHLVKLGFEPKNDTYKKLYKRLDDDFSEDDKEEKEKLEELVLEIFKHDTLKEKYLHVNKDVEVNLDPLFIEKQNKALNTYLKSFERISKEYNANSEKIDESVNSIREMLNPENMNEMFIDE